MERVLIAGCGRIGTQLGTKLSESGYTVFGLRRNGTLPAPIHTINGDMTCLTELPQHFDYIVFTGSADNYTLSSYKSAYVDSLKNLVQRLDRAPKRLIFTSSTAVYGQHQGEWVDETSITEPNGFAGEYLLEAEHFLEAQPFDTTVVRFSGIYGPDYRGLLDQVINRKAQLTSEPHYTNRIHSVDCARLLEFLIKANELEGLYLGTDSEPTEKNEVIHWLEQQLGLEQTQEIGQQLPKRGNKRCANQKIVDAGFSFQYPTYQEGYQTLITASASI